MKKQQKFKVEENETIQACLQRMRDAGYMPIKRFENQFIKKIKMVNMKYTGKKFNLLEN